MAERQCNGRVTAIECNDNDSDNDIHMTKFSHMYQYRIFCYSEFL